MEYYIGIDIGGTKIAVAIVNAQNEIVCKTVLRTNPPRPFSDILDEIEEAVTNLVTGQNIKWSDIDCIGVASPGFVKNGVVNGAVNLGLNNVDMKTMFQNRFGIYTSVINDANAVAFAEAILGEGRGKNHVVAVTVGTGIGGGMVINKKIVEGTSGAAAEIGHMVIHAGGLKCPCGNRGCFECYCSTTALSNKVKASAAVDTNLLNMYGSLENINGKTIFEKIRVNEPKTAEIFNEFAADFALGLINIVALLEPDVIIIGGGLSKEGHVLLNPILEKLGEFGFSKTAKTIITTAKMCNDAGIIGAVLKARAK